MRAIVLLLTCACALWFQPVLAKQAAPAPAGISQSNDTIEQGEYINSDGQRIHRPAHTRSGQPPADASAQCRDGSFSFSTHHRGTCSGHHGVAQWYK